MAVNEGAKLFYELHGFATEQEESSNQAHYRYTEKGSHQHSTCEGLNICAQVLVISYCSVKKQTLFKP